MIKSPLATDDSVGLRERARSVGGKGLLTRFAAPAFFLVLNVLYSFGNVILRDARK